jgi:D-3-phosphoglycerate dehydrogenase
MGMFNADRLARMRRGAFIVNTARGGIIDEPALHGALTRRGAGLGVFTWADASRQCATAARQGYHVAHMAGVTTGRSPAYGRNDGAEHLSVLDGKPNGTM